MKSVIRIQIILPVIAAIAILYQFGLFAAILFLFLILNFSVNDDLS